LHLRRKTDRIFYHRHDDGTEVDFVVGDGKDLQLIQISADITSQDTRKRELTALEAAMARYGLKEATVVTLTADETVRVKGGTVRIVPAAAWLTS
jgi:predicted AAA+ superfamily ATPase